MEGVTDLDFDRDRRAQTLNAEQAVLGSVLIAPDIARAVLAELPDDVWMFPQNLEIAQAVRDLIRTGDPVDPFTVCGRYESIFGPDHLPELRSYAAQLIAITPTAENWREYARIVLDAADLRKIVALTEKIHDAAMQSGRDECRSLIAALSAVGQGRRKGSAWTLKELVTDFLQSQDPDRTPPPEYIECGIPSIDAGLYLERGDVLIIGGDPSSGKTCAGLQFAAHMAKKYKVGFFSLETDKRKIRDRLAAHLYQVDNGKIKKLALSESEWESVAKGVAETSERKFTLVHAAGYSTDDIASASAAYGFDVIFVDYVQLVKAAAGRGGTNLRERLTDVSMGLHTFAQSTGTLVVELAQLSRPERGKWTAPTIHDLKETGQFEQDADVIMLLYKPGPKMQMDPDKTRVLKIAKNKEGQTARWPLAFDGPRQTFSLLADQTGQIARHYAEQGRRAKAKKADAMDGQTQFDELDETADLPF